MCKAFGLDGEGGGLVGEAGGLDGEGGGLAVFCGGFVDRGEGVEAGFGQRFFYCV